MPPTHDRYRVRARTSRFFFSNHAEQRREQLRKKGASQETKSRGTSHVSEGVRRHCQASWGPGSIPVRILYADSLESTGLCRPAPEDQSVRVLARRLAFVVHRGVPEGVGWRRCALLRISMARPVQGSRASRPALRCAGAGVTSVAVLCLRALSFLKSGINHPC